jgi:hypothetical protein
VAGNDHDRTADLRVPALDRRASPAPIVGDALFVRVVFEIELIIVIVAASSQVDHISEAWILSKQHRLFAQRPCI